MSDDLTYLDSSALVKVVVEEAESTALNRYLAGRPERATSALARTELVRAVAPHGSEKIDRARNVLLDLRLIDVDDGVLDAAATLQPVSMRSLDAIHLASALSLGEELGVAVTYDRRMIDAALFAGLTVESPS